MSAAPLSERLGRFVRLHFKAGCDVEIHHVSRGLVVHLDRSDNDSVEGSDVETMALDHAACLHGKQGYELRAVFPEGGVKASLPFRVQGGEGREEDGAAEPGNRDGLLAMVLKHNDRLLLALERQSKPTVDALETLGKMLSRYLEQQNELFLQQLEVSKLQAEREAQQRRDALSEKRWNATERMLTPIVKSIGAKWFPSAEGRKDVLHEFAASLDEQQRKAIEALLQPDQHAMLARGEFSELMASVIERGQLETIMPLLRPEQIALIDAAAMGKAP